MTATGNKPPAVLLVNDDDVTRGAMTQVLQKHGYDVCSASTIAEALSCLDGKDFLIVDMELPDGVGLTVLHKARTDHPSIKTAVYTGADDEAPMHAIADHHPDHVFHKPVMAGAIMDWLNAHSRSPAANDTSPQQP